MRKTTRQHAGAAPQDGSRRIWLLGSVLLLAAAIGLAAWIHDQDPGKPRCRLPDGTELRLMAVLREGESFPPPVPWTDRVLFALPPALRPSPSALDRLSLKATYVNAAPLAFVIRRVGHGALDKADLQARICDARGRPICIAGCETEPFSAARYVSLSFSPPSWSWSFAEGRQRVDQCVVLQCPAAAPQSPRLQVHFEPGDGTGAPRSLAVLVARNPLWSGASRWGADRLPKRAEWNAGVRLASVRVWELEGETRSARYELACRELARLGLSEFLPIRPVTRLSLPSLSTLFHLRLAVPMAGVPPAGTMEIEDVELADSNANVVYPEQGWYLSSGTRGSLDAVALLRGVAIPRGILRVRARLVRSSRAAFRSDETWTVANIPVPPRGNRMALGRAHDFRGTRLLLHSVDGNDPNLPSRPTRRITLGFSLVQGTALEEARLRVLAGPGVNLRPNADPGWYTNSSGREPNITVEVPVRARTMSLTLALDRARTADFYIDPVAASKYRAHQGTGAPSGGDGPGAR